MAPAMAMVTPLRVFSHSAAYPRHTKADRHPYAPLMADVAYHGPSLFNVIVDQLKKTKAGGETWS